MTILGAVCLPSVAPERLPNVARAAEEAALDELWLWEDCFLAGGLTSAAAALASTQRLRVGVGLLPVPLRNVAVTAMEVGALHRLFAGRVQVGVGHGVQDWMGQVGARVDSPMTLLREYVTALRALLRGETVTTSGRYVRLDAVALGWPPLFVPALLAGATGPRSLRLCGEVADGTILTAATTPEAVRAARRLVDAGRAAAHRESPHPITAYLLAATGPRAAERLEAEVRSWGGDPAQIGAAGDAQAVADGVRRWADAGADRVVLQPLADDTDPDGFVRFVGRDVGPLVGGTRPSVA